MPVLSRFYGIVIYMYNNGREHNPPHFHAEYQDCKAIFYLDGRIDKGKMPKSQTKMISEWAKIHQDELLKAWDLAVNEEPLFWIEPLR